MVMSTEQAAALIAAAQEAASNGGEIPTELRCQYPSKRCDHVRTIKRGGGLHRLCSFHRQRANKNQWLVDQRRRLRREREGSLMRRGSSSMLFPISPSTAWGMELQPAVLHALDVLDADSSCPDLCDEDLHILQALLFDEEDEELCDLSDGFVTDGSMEFTV